MPTFHTLDEAIKEFDKKFYSIPDKTCLWHRNVDLRQFLSLVWQSAQEARNRELAEKIEEKIIKCERLENDAEDNTKLVEKNLYMKLGLEEVLSLINK